MGTGCTCAEDSCGNWRASVTITADINVYLLDRRPHNPELLRNEENKHVMLFMSVLDSRIAAGKALEAQTFSYKWTCELSCWAFKARSKAELIYYSPWTHIATPHPY